MNLQTRKLEFIKELLKVQSEEVLERLENLLKKERHEQPASVEADILNNRIEVSEADFANNRFKTSSELIEKYK